MTRPDDSSEPGGEPAKATVVNAQSIENVVLDLRPSDPRLSPAYRRAVERSNTFTMLGGASAGIAIVALLAADAISYSFHLAMREFIVVCVAVGIVGVVLLGVGQVIRIRARLTYFSDVAAGAQDRVVDEFLRRPHSPEAVDDLAELLISTREQMRFYDAMARGQASKAFYLSVGAMIAGLVIIVVGIVIALRETSGPGGFVAAGLSAVGTVTSGYISKTFLEMHNRTMQQLNYYFQQPLVQSHTLMAKRLAKDLSEAERDTAVRAIVDALLVNVSRSADSAAAPRNGK